MTLLAIPNVSEGRRPGVIAAIVAAIVDERAAVLDVHADPDHHRSVFTVAGPDERLVAATVAVARVALNQLDLGAPAGLHPHVGALDVAPIVYLDPADRGRACATALVLADTLAEALALPVLLYGELAGGRGRAELRRGGPGGLAARIESGELRPDFGPGRADPRAGVTLVGARPPLIAFNVELASPAGLTEARAIAAAIRERGSQGLPGVRAIGLWLDHRGVAQVSMNLEDFRRASPADAVAAIARRAPVLGCELVGLAPRAAFADFPRATVPVRNLRLLEDALG